MSDLDERIRQRAYQLWEAEGRPEGRANDHWYRARERVVEEDIARAAEEAIRPLGIPPIENPSPMAAASAETPSAEAPRAETSWVETTQVEALISDVAAPAPAVEVPKAPEAATQKRATPKPSSAEDSKKKVGGKIPSKAKARPAKASRADGRNRKPTV
jgi:hypothetical protein